MSFLRRVLGGSGERGPEWASFMSAASYRRFEELVRMPPDEFVQVLNSLA